MNLAEEEKKVDKPVNGTQTSLLYSVYIKFV